MSDPVDLPNRIYHRLVPVLDDSKPNFSPAAWRTVAAGKRLSEILQLIPELAQEWKGYPNVRAPRDNPNDIQMSLVDWQWSQMPTARTLTNLASEVLHHARVALDYCAYHVVWQDGGSVRNNTKFPLVTDLNRWGRELRSSLPSINYEHTQWIHEVQPFQNVEWSTNLVMLSNRDKHRLAVDVIPTYQFLVDRGKLYADPLGDPKFVGFAVEESQLILNIAPSLDEQSRSSHGLPLESTLIGIVQGVVDLINRFLLETGYSAISMELTKPNEVFSPGSS